MGKPEPSIFDETDAAADEASARRGEADYLAGRVVSHEAVLRWLKTWGKGEKTPPPKCGE